MKIKLVLLLLLLILICANFTTAQALFQNWQHDPGTEAVASTDPPAAVEQEPVPQPEEEEGDADAEAPVPEPDVGREEEIGDSQEAVQEGGEKKMVPDPQDILVLVNKEYNLPADYVPPDLVQPAIPFSFSEDLPKKKMRREAAQALEELVQAAAEEGIELVGVSGYRSYQYQEAIFTAKARERGEEVANRTSARPGQSEHQTGLAMDLSCSKVGYALIEEFGNTPEGIWLAENAPRFGFIIRYPEGKEHLTGYSYEPWHIRYVGVEVAQEITAQGLVLEEYLAENQNQGDELALRGAGQE